MKSIILTVTLITVAYAANIVPKEQINVVTEQQTDAPSTDPTAPTSPIVNQDNPYDYLAQWNPYCQYVQRLPQYDQYSPQYEQYPKYPQFPQPQQFPQQYPQPQQPQQYDPYQQYIQYQQYLQFLQQYPQLAQQYYPDTPYANYPPALSNTEVKA